MHKTKLEKYKTYFTAIKIINWIKKEYKMNHIEAMDEYLTYRQPYTLLYRKYNKGREKK